MEVDQWFWSLFATGAKLPDVGTVKRYAESVPEGFTFSVKAPNSITDDVASDGLALFTKKYSQRNQ